MLSFPLVAFDQFSPLSIKGSIEVKSKITLSYQWDRDIIETKEMRSKRIIGLWEETCFEAFFLKEDNSYDEWNFSPQGGWNAFQFSGYREKKSPWEIENINVPDFKINKKELIVTLDEFSFSSFQLSAVIKTDHKKAYYALSHPHDSPDFHHPKHFKKWSPS